MKRWTDSTVIEFVNWYLNIFNLPTNYQLENEDILKSFKKGEDYSIWQNEIQLMDHDYIKSLIQFGHKLKAVKYVKEQTNWGLKEAKEYVDNYTGF